MFGKMKLGIKIGSGYALAIVLLALAIVITVRQVNAISGLTNRIASLRVPTAQASLNMLNGLNHSLAALRGWMLLGNDTFRTERQSAWKEELDSSLLALTEFSKNWTNPENVKRLVTMRSDLQNFRSFQQEVEDIANTIGNTPATKILFEKAAPVANIIIQDITRMIDLEGQLEATTERKALLGMMADVRGSMGMALASIRAYLLGGDKKFKDEFEGYWETNTRRFRDLETNSGLLTPEQQDAFNRLTEAREEFSDYPPRMLEIRGAEDWNLANYWLATKAAPVAGKIKAILETMVEDQQVLLGDDVSESVALTKMLVVIEWVLLATCVVILLIFGVVLTRSITRPLNALTEISKKIAIGDFNVETLERKSKDELGMLADSFGSMIEALRQKARAVEQIAEGDLTTDVKLESDRDGLGKSLSQMVRSLNDVMGQVSTAIEQVSTGSSQVSQASQALSQGAAEQASSLEEISSSLNEISSQSKQNAESATEANSIAKTAVENAESGNEQMSELVGAMEKINESSAEIKKVVKVIDDIAFQINLLALNANVEAARAGKYGKGFAVVAEEVRNLAVRSAEAVKGTTRRVEESTKSIELGRGAAEKTAKQLEEIVSGSSKVADFLGEIALASKEQAQGVEQINSGLEQIDQVTQSNTASAEESASAAEELSSQAQQLKALVARFKLAENGRSGGNGGRQYTAQVEPERRRELGRVGAVDRTGNDNGDSGEKEVAMAGTARKGEAGQSRDPREVINLDDDDFGKF